MGTKSKSFALIIVILFLTSLAMDQPATVKAQSKTITVPDDYPTIQSAIGNASDGDTVFVEKGIYRENIIIDKSLTLTGENNQDTVIEGVPKRFENNPTIAVEANDVTISGFTITGGYNGISVGNFSGCRVVSNIISNNLESGVQLSGEDALVSGNDFLGNNFCGVHVYFSKNSQVSNNTIGGSYSSEVGVIIDSSVNITITKNTISSNGVSNEPDSHRGGIRLGRSVSCNVFGNIISDNHGYGVMFAEDVNATQVHDNSIASNNVGVELFNFLIFGEDQIGIQNQVWNNNLVDNIQQAVVHSGLSGVLPNPPYTNGTDIVFWDNGTVGNYWSDYAGNGTYVIDQNNIDHHPLTKPVDISSSEFTLLSAILIAGILAVIALVLVIVSLLLYRRHRKTNSKFSKSL
jgi:nitrous oxidase accessory protein